jgi:RNA methyltransferase, TrmH family
MKKITSLQNDLIKHVHSLQNLKYRTKHQQFIAEGLRTIETMLQKTSNLELVTLFCTDKTIKLAKRLISEQQIVTVSEVVMQKISTNNSPAELLAVFKQRQLAITQNQLTAGLVLAQIADPGNMGTLIRSAAAMGYQTVVIIEGCEHYNPKVVQASAGTIALVNIFKFSWQELLANKHDLALCALVVKDGVKPNELALKNSLLVVGNEANGLPAAWVQDCEQKLTIPMPGATESLNVAVAGSIALYLAANY